MKCNDAKYLFSYKLTCCDHTVLMAYQYHQHSEYLQYAGGSFNSDIKCALKYGSFLVAFSQKKQTESVWQIYRI